MTNKILLACLSVFTFSLAAYFTSLAYDNIHPIPHCECGEYQVNVEMDHATIWDGDKYVGTLQADSTQAFDKLIIRDNE